MSGDRDDAYWERRRKNNEAAKRSRDARRAKEQEVAVRAQFLEQENISMKMEIAHLKAENAQLRSKFQQHLTLKLWNQAAQINGQKKFPTWKVQL